MTKKEESKEITELSSETEDSGKQETQEKTYTQKEIDALNVQLAEERRLRQEADRASTQHLQRAEQWESTVQGLRDEIRLVAALAAEGRPSEDAENLSQAEKGDVLTRFDARQREQEARRTADQYRQRVEALGLTENDDDYWAIHDHVVSGNPSRLKAADTKLKKLEQAKGESVDKETEEQKIEKLAQEKAEEKLRQMMEEKGLLKTDTSGPQAAGRSFAEKEQGYIDGTVSREEYIRAAKEAGKNL